MLVRRHNKGGKGGLDLGGRAPTVVLRGLLEPRNLLGGLRVLALVKQPFRYLRYYLIDGPQYPITWRVRTPAGPIELTTYSHADILTIFVCFLRQDYAVDARQAHNIVDVGANIGISAAYFMTRSAHSTARVLCIEPVPTNIERLRLNLRPFETQYRLLETAVSDFDGTVAFGVESTGVFGGIGVQGVDEITVPCREINAILDEALASEAVDVLKLDIEGLEIKVAEAIHTSNQKQIRLAFLEAAPSHSLWATSHDQRQRGAICILEQTSVAVGATG